MAITEGALEGFSHYEDHRVGFHVEHESNIFRLRITDECTIREVAQLQREIDAILMPSTLFSDHVGEIELG